MILGFEVRVFSAWISQDKAHGAGREEDLFLCACNPRRVCRATAGIRDAALDWAQAYLEVLEGMGFVKGQSSPCSFYHEVWKIRTIVQGDDFLSEGPGKNLEEMDNRMRKLFALKTAMLGGDPGDVKSLPSRC